MQFNTYLLKCNSWSKQRFVISEQIQIHSPEIWR